MEVRPRTGAGVELLRGGRGGALGGRRQWSEIVRETRAEEGDLFRMFSRTGEALLQIAGLRRSHPEAANMAAAVAEMVLREPIR